MKEADLLTRTDLARGRFHVAESFCSPQTTQRRQSSKLLARIRCNCLVILETTGTSLQSWWSDKSPTPMADAFSVIAQACTTSHPHTYTQHTCTTSHTHTHTHMHNLTHTHTHTHAQPHTHTYTHAQPHTRYTQHTCTTSHTHITHNTHAQPHTRYTHHASPPATNQGVIYTGLYGQAFGTIHICLNNHIDCKLRKSGVSL